MRFKAINDPVVTVKQFSEAFVSNLRNSPANFRGISQLIDFRKHSGNPFFSC